MEECPSQEPNSRSSSQEIANLSKKQNYSGNMPWRPIEFWDVKDPTFSRQSAHRWQSGCQPYAPAVLYSPETFSGIHFYYRLSKPQGHSAAVRIR
jgi:hypothetical protein